MKSMKLAGNEKTTMYKNILFNHFKLFLYAQNSKKKKRKKKYSKKGNLSRKSPEHLLPPLASLDAGN